MSLSFVNLNGEPVSVAQKKVKKDRTQGPAEFHKGWKVVGIPPGEYERAVEENTRQQAIDEKCNSEVRKDLPPYEVWRNSAKLKPVRSKPYEIHEAADQCADLARKAGWDKVYVVEMKKEAVK
jgi:hypothetical protein